MKALEPCLVVFTGMAAAGKSTIGKEIARRVLNVVYFDRDPGMWAMLTTRTASTENLPSFWDYVRHDLLPHQTKLIGTFMGPMLKICHRGDFFRRHVDCQSYLVLAAYAAELVRLRKVVIVEPFLQNMIEDGSLKRFLELECFSNLPRRVIHFVADMRVLFERHRERMASSNFGDDERSARTMFSTADFEAFEREMQATHSGEPKGLKEIPHLTLDTTGRSIDECVFLCIRYIKNGHNETA